MKNFKLLLKNSLKSLWNSRGLVTQFTALTTIATIVVSSISLGNFSLRNSMAKVQKESNANGFSIQSKNVQDFATYNIVNESNGTIKNLNDLTMNEASLNTKIYNPLKTSTTFTFNDNQQDQYETHGFFQKYSNEYIDPTTSTTSHYTEPQGSPSSKSWIWNNIVFSKGLESLSINSDLVDLTTYQYNNEISDIFTLYNNILPPSPNDVQQSKYEIFFDPNIYAFNPWTLTFDETQPNDMKVNSLGIATIDGFQSENKYNMLFNHGVFDSKYLYIVGTDVSYLGKDKMANYSQEIQRINSAIKLSMQYSNAFSNNWKQPTLTKDFTSSQDLIDLMITLASLFDKFANIYNDNYYKFLNSLTNNLKNNFIMESKKFRFKYSIDWNKSEGISKYFGEIYNDPNNKYHQQINQLFKDESKYFEGNIEIPVIPFITVSPKNSIQENWTLEQYKKWATDGFLDFSQTQPNVSGIQNVLSESFNQLSNRANKVFKEKLNIKETVGVKPEELKEIRNQYYVDYDIDYFINKAKLDFSKSSNFTISDSNNNTFIMNKNKFYSNKKVNSLVINNGRALIENKIDENYLKLPSTINEQNSLWLEILKAFGSHGTGLTEQQQKDFFLNDNIFWTWLNILKESKLNTNNAIINAYHGAIAKALDLNLFINNFSQWKLDVISFLETFPCNLFAWNGAGYNIEFTRKNSMGIGIDFNAIYNEPSSFMSVVSLNYSQIKNGSKQIINSKFAEEACKLPFKMKNITEEDFINNFNQYKKHFIYNPYTDKKEFYNDFVDWMNKLDQKFKVQVNGDEFVIIGTGISSEFVYPITSSNQLLINNNAPVLFTNELGYDKIANNNTVVQQSNYFVNFKNKYDYLANVKTLNNVNDWTKRVNHDKLAYKLDDADQPNQLLYLRMNFPYKILNIVLVITSIIAGIVVCLSFIFIFVLMKSIVNQNINTFAVGMANGISKRKLLFSFMPFVIIPSFISAILGYSFSFLLYPTISNAIQNYWILEYIKFPFNPGYLTLAFLFLTIVIFTVQTIVVYTLLNRNVPNLLNAKMEFKYNKLVQHSHKMVSKLSPLASFRITYMLGNFGRFLLLLLMMTSFVSLTTISASTTNTFNTAIQKTVDNKQYNYAIDLITPTVQGGYYYDIPYDLLGSRQKGLTPLYDLNKNAGFYGKDYKEVLTYNMPDSNESVVYENLFLPQAGLIGDVQGNVTFFRNKIIHLLTMDFGINFLGNYINPWEWAKKILPTSVINLVEAKLQQQLNYAFMYICWLNTKNSNNPEKNMWLYDTSNNPSFLDYFNGSTNPKNWDQSNWLVQLINVDGKYKWKPNDQYQSNGLPNFTMTKQVVNLVTRVISFDKNIEYQEFIKQYEQKNNKKVIDNNFMLGLNVVPIIPELDETYTYIEANTNLNKKDVLDIKMLGIKPNSSQVILWDEYNNEDLKYLLSSYQVKNDIYPLIINEVVHKKYKLNINDVIEIKAKNKYDRFVTKFENKPDLERYKFKVLGITTSKSEEQYYTTQEIANKILGFEKPKLATQGDLVKNYDYKWVNQNEIDEYVPFNGVFSKQELPKMLTNFLTLYSTSGLSPIGGILPNSGNGDTYWQIYENYSELNSILKTNFVDETKPKNYDNIKIFCDEYQRVFGNNKYFNPGLYSLDATFASSLLGNVMDSTVKNINFVCMISLLPAILIIIILMSYMIVVESRRLVALLKVLGFSNWSNTITLSTVQFVVVGLAVLLGYGFSALVLSLVEVFAFNALSIIVSPTIPAWTAAITLGVLALIVTTITLTIFLNLRKTNPAKEIAMR